MREWNDDVVIVSSFWHNVRIKIYRICRWLGFASGGLSNSLYIEDLVTKSMKLDQITYDINGCAMKVHNSLGNGFQEVIYQRCLAIEMKKAGMVFQREEEHDIFYEGYKVGTRRADFIVEGKVVVELKALISMEDVHLAQAKNYVVAYNKPVGLLINFGGRSLQFRKIYNPKYDLAND